MGILAKPLSWLLTLLYGVVGNYGITVAILTVIVKIALYPLYKKQKITYEKFFEFWTGYAIFLEPDVGFKKDNKKLNLLFKFIPVFNPHKKSLFFHF